MIEVREDDREQYELLMQRIREGYLFNDLRNWRKHLGVKISIVKRYHASLLAYRKEHSIIWIGGKSYKRYNE